MHGLTQVAGTNAGDGGQPRTRRILVTGGSGFVGRQAVAALVAGRHEVYVVSRHPRAFGAPNVHSCQSNLLDAGAADRLLAEVRPEFVLHMAWNVEPGQFWTDPANLDWMAASLRLAQASANHAVTRFVGVGTCFEYDWPSDGRCIEGTTPLTTHTLYDAAKSGLFAALSRFFALTPCQFAWARLFYLYGPGEDPARLVASLARSLALGEPAKTSSGLVRRDFIDTRHAGAALAAITLSDVEGPVNVGSGQGLRIVDIARKLAELAGRPELLQVGSLPDRQGEPPCIVADTTILRQKVGFVAEFDLEAGLAAALREARN